MTGTRFNVVVHPEVTTTIDLRLRMSAFPKSWTLSPIFTVWISSVRGGYTRSTPIASDRIFPIDYLHFKRKGGSETRVSSGQVTSSRSSAGNSDAGNGETGAWWVPHLHRDESDFWQDLRTSVEMIVSTGEDGQVIVNLARSDHGEGWFRAAAAGGGLPAPDELIMQRQVVLEAKILEVALNEGYSRHQLVRSPERILGDGFRRPAGRFHGPESCGQAIRTRHRRLFPPPSGRAASPL
ncbi:secretin N-terminal domain-containing protein [Halomonas beimenensis]|uniref:secretin N-terminal domain-containing protein n=1 Tax=Halomonas beimenensis TaxID=475662 RepID=UPI003620610E